MSQSDAQTPRIHVDDDWKRQAQAEKDRLAAEQQQAAEAAGPLPPASFAALIQRVAMEVSLYLGDLRIEGAPDSVNPEMAKFNIDLLAVIEEKTRGNLTAEEKRLLDGVLYELRMRYVQAVSG